MNNIQMVDLVGQYKKIKKEIQVELNDIFEKSQFINGPVVGEFQNNLEDYLNVRNVIPCANGTDALQIIMMAFNFPKGSEVLVPSFTYIATVEVIALLDLKPIFVEVNPNSFNIDLQDLESKISKRSVAIIPVHLFGQCAYMEPILELANKYDLKVIEDTAQAIGSDYKYSDGTTQKAGTIGNVGSTSFFPSKNLGGYGDGGAIMTNDDELAVKLRMIANHGQSKKYYHDSIGVNSRLDSLQAAILKVKLKYLNRYNEARYKVAQKYSEAFSNLDWIIPPFESHFSSHVYHQYTLKLSPRIDRQEFIQYLLNAGIPSMIYYPVPCHLQKAYKHFGYKVGDLKTTESLSRTVLSLPIHTEMDEKQQDFIIKTIKAFRF